MYRSAPFYKKTHTLSKQSKALTYKRDKSSNEHVLFFSLLLGFFITDNSNALEMRWNSNCRFASVDLSVLVFVKID